MYNQFGIEAGIISGYAKFSKRIENDREWNYIKLNNTYYLIDVSYKDWFRNKEEIYIYIMIIYMSISVLNLKYLYALIFLKKLNGNY